jgi:DNA-binding NtrC family response regulator
LLEVTNVGKKSLLCNGKPVNDVVAAEGMVLEIEHELLLLVSQRPLEMPLDMLDSSSLHEFGRSDRHGLVGESPAIWRLRSAIIEAAPSPHHVMILGPSGTGKELVAHALHSLSSRAKLRMLVRNAATIPEGLIDAEVFGNKANYPNPGMPASPGLIGAAEGSTLFLD